MKRILKPKPLLKVISTIAIILVITGLKTNAQTTGAFEDNRDGKTYKTVKIGSQVWMAENLAFKAENGCWAYDGTQSNVTELGYLYNWETAKNVCPNAYHLPSNDEWEQLAEYINSVNETVSRSYYGDWENMGNLLKAESGWNSHVNETNKFGFAALLGGYRRINGDFSDKYYYGSWWSSSVECCSDIWSRSLNSKNDCFYNNSNDKSAGHSVRCVKN